jgi:translation initiation factor IF-2
MNISTLAKIIGVSITELKEVGANRKIPGFNKKNTRISYNSALEITKILRPNKVKTLKNDENIYVPATITVIDLAHTINQAPGIVIKTLMMNGILATLNEKLDFDTASLIASELGVQVVQEKGEFNTDDSQDLSLIKTFSNNDLDQKDLTTRPPIVTVMGHVDHGKTTLLDTIRKANVVAGEAGSITQHISSYQIEYKPADKELGKHLVKGKKGIKITFVDTPGHAAFTSMRVRGTQLADILILMVSVTEGCKPQTIEVIERAKISNTPVIVALNKIDLPDADPEKTMQEVASYGLVPEEWGGQTPFIKISAKNNLNIEQLLDRILFEAELREFKGLATGKAEAVVVETLIDTKAGAQATVLITKGKLMMGDIIECGLVSGKIKRIINSEGKSVQSAEIAEPVTIYGVSDHVAIGDMLRVFSTVKEANNYIQAQNIKSQGKKIFNNNSVDTGNTLNIIIKADVAGSLEALKESLLKIPQEQTKIVIKSESVGQINETDVDYAKTTNSTILAFHTSIATSALKHIEANKTSIISSDIIYEILEWCQTEILSRIKHEYRAEVLGFAEVLATFKSDKNNTQIIGGEVKKGKLIAHKLFRVIRSGELLGKIEVKELQKNKSKVNEINIAQQFGASFGTKVKILKGDIIECFDEIIIK